MSTACNSASDSAYISLYQFTDQLIQRTVREVQKGDRDRGRDIVRYVRNARIVEILASHTYSLSEPNWPLLRWKVDELDRLVKSDNLGVRPGATAVDTLCAEATPPGDSSESHRVFFSPDLQPASTALSSGSVPGLQSTTHQ